ncbi:MAG: hypothetical protein KAK00_07455 [Nanoarchaeota archaeon]|nr:hypothetical protein [Nanoarchaeota archaeon]
MKKCALTFFLFLLMSIIFSSAAIFEYQETDYVNLRPQAYDQDNDTLTYFFNKPLSKKGTWQTDYGDAGIYNTKVTVSDGRLLTTENVTLVIYKKEEFPEIEVIAPKQEELYIGEGDSIFFNVAASDINEDKLNITWLLDEEPVSEGTYYVYISDFYSEGTHTLEAVVSDSVNDVSTKWTIEVGDFDRSLLLGDFLSITVKETDLLELTLPDFESYSLSYNISEPLGNDAKWQTTYDDAGLYTAIIKIWDDIDFSAEIKIKILVENVDRPPELLDISSYWISEGQQLEIPLNYTDLDGDEVDVTVYGLPEGAYFRSNTIKWKPSFDTVTKETILDDIARNYHIMNKQFIMYVDASSNNLTTTQQIKVRVFNNNRKPVIVDVPDITINAGDIVNFEVLAYDTDNDSLTFSFKGIINKNNYKTNDDQVGTHQVKVTVSDGFLKDEKYAKVNILPVNQPPTLNDISPITTDENQLVEIILDAKCPDEDELTYSVYPMPKGSYFKSNRFIWTPGYDTVIRDKSKILELTFMVEDNSLNATKSTTIVINNVNRPLILTSSAQIDNQEFYIGDEIMFSVDVFDPDNDDLSYTWQTSPFKSLKTGNTLVLKYNTPGKKKVSVTVSDGKESVKREWTVILKKRPEVKLFYLKQ